MSFCYNQATLVGRLTRDPEYRQISQTTAKTIFTIAISRGFKKESGASETDFIPVCLWGRLAELGFQLLRKGTPVLVCGRIQVRNYEKNNEKRWSTEIVVDSFQILGSTSTQKKEKEAAVQMKGDNLEVIAEFDGSDKEAPKKEVSKKDTSKKEKKAALAA